MTFSAITICLWTTVTTEHERAGGYGKIKNGEKVRVHPDSDHDYPNEFGAFRSSARHRHTRNKTDYKGFTDVLSPLRGPIRKNLGRKWDAVFSEFCRVLDRRSLSGYHIWTHLMQEVQTETFLENGTVSSGRHTAVLAGLWTDSMCSSDRYPVSRAM